LYDNQLVPTDQLRADWGFGPLSLTAFLGSQSNDAFNSISNVGFAGNNPYRTSGSVFYLDTGGAFSSTAVGFPGVAAGAGTGAEDNEALIRASLNVFRISGQPVTLGLNELADGYAFQKGRGADLTIPLFNRTVGIEYIGQRAQAASGGAAGEPTAYIVTVPLLRTNPIDLDVAYGKADDGFEYFVTSSANPYARSYGEAIFYRPLALGSPLINTSGAGPAFAAAKKTWDFKGTARIPFGFLRRIPLDFRYYTAKSSAGIGGAGTGRADLGKVYSIGTSWVLSPGLNFEVKTGIYKPGNGTVSNIHYYRVGANVGF